MAKLTPDQAQALIKTPKNIISIQRAKRQQDQLMFHCEPVTDISDFSPAYKEHLSWVRSFMKDEEKMVRYTALLTAPNPNVTSTKTIFDELGKVFETDDKVLKYEFVSDEIEADANDFLSRQNLDDFWQVEAFDALRVAIASIVVVDMPSVQLTDRPEPYFYFVDINNVVDVTFKDKGEVDYLIFTRKDKKIVVIDEKSYMVFEKEKDGSDYILVGEPAVHSTYDEATGELTEGLGYAPATSFYDSPIAKTERINKKGPITASLSNLNWLLFWKVSKKYFDLYGAWPIIVSYKQNCTYRDEHGNECNEGYVNYDEFSYATGDAVSIPRQKACPVCSKRGMIGAGSRWTVDPPVDAADVDLMANPIKIIEVSNEKLEYVRDEQERLENEIYMDSVGWDGDAMNAQAVNENQVAANFESKESVLDNIQKQFERVRKFVTDTQFRFRYGDYFLRSTVFLGRNYFLQTVGDLTKQYNDAKNAGLPQYMIQSLRDKIARNQNRNNPEQAQRDFILSNLEPYPDMSLAQLTAMQVQFTDPDGYQIKINFNTFIQRFEREQMNIIEFASLIPFNTKISIIQSKLKDYAKEKAPIPRPITAGIEGSTV